MAIFFAVVALLLGTVMSASIGHKEIQLDHNGVHYTVAVDAEKQHGTLDSEHQDEIGQIDINYETPHGDHLHHNDEAENNPVVLHIELGGHHTHHENEWEHHHQHHGLFNKHEDTDDVNDDSHSFEINRVNFKRQIPAHGPSTLGVHDPGHLTHQSTPLDNVYVQNVGHQGGLPHEWLNDVNVHHSIDNTYLQNQAYPQVSHEWLNDQEVHHGGYPYIATHHPIGHVSHIGQHHGFGKNIVGHLKGSSGYPFYSTNLQHVLLNDDVPYVLPTGLQSGIENEQMYVGTQPVYPNHLAGFHH